MLELKSAINNFIIPDQFVWGDFLGFKMNIIDNLKNYVDTINYGLSVMEKNVKTTVIDSTIIDYYYSTYGIPKFLSLKKIRKDE